jgi:hypothetical protein
MNFIRPITLILIILFIILGVNKVDEPKMPEVQEKRVWTVEDSKAYARDRIQVYANKQWACLNKLWIKESNWRKEAYNDIKVMGKNAGGIPQILGMSPKLKPTYQIDRGLSYIEYRYLTPCQAWKHHVKEGWY